MNAQQEKHADLIRALINALISYPEKLTLEAKQFRNATYWHATPAGDDYPMINGQKGANYRALAFLITELGRASGEQAYNFRLEEPHPGPRHGFIHTELARQYDPLTAQALLQELLTEYLADPSRLTVTKTGSVPLRFTFEIQASSRRDHQHLSDPDVGAPGSTLTLLDALREVFTAYGRREGVQFQVVQV